nr:alternative ribosome rescue aminoacyl-tRNA hydrolase ArfB [Simiduia agarivorans]
MVRSLAEKLLAEVDISFTLSQGAGGQNVNKVATAVQMRFDVKNSPLISEHCRQRLLNSGDTRLTNDGVLVIRAQEYRTQLKNKEAALARLLLLIQDASQVQKKRRATKPSRAAKERRLKAKTERGQIKRARGKVDF